MQKDSDTYYVSPYSPKYTYSISKAQITKKVVNGITYTGDYSPAGKVTISDNSFWGYWDGTNGSYRYKIQINDNIHFTVNASNSIGEKAFWSSSNEYVATVDENGVVTGHHNGTAEITCTMEGGKKDTQKITVGNPEILNRYNYTGCVSLNVSEKMKFGSLDDEGKWISSNPSVASVSADGEVTALSEGYCTISFTRVDGLKGSVKFHIIDEDKDYYSEYIYLKKGDSLYCPTLAEMLANKKTNVLSCDPDGTIHAIEEGEVVLITTYVDENITGIISEITIWVYES